MSLGHSFETVRRDVEVVLRRDWGDDVHVSEVIEKPYGWVVFYNTKAFLQSRDPNDGLMSNSPFIYTKEGRIIHLMMAHRLDVAIAEAERLFLL